MPCKRRGNLALPLQVLQSLHLSCESGSAFGSNDNILTDKISGKKIVLCALNLMSFHLQGSLPSECARCTHTMIMLAAHHLDTGDASIVPELENLPNKCPVWFLVKGMNNKQSVDKALKAVVIFWDTILWGPSLFLLLSLGPFGQQDPFRWLPSLVLGGIPKSCSWPQALC